MTMATAKSALARMAALTVAATLVTSWAEAGKRRRGSVAIMAPDWASAPSVRYADMAGPACLAELAKRKITYQRVDEAPGVVTPVRIVDGVGDVVYRTALPRSRRAHNPHDVFDCRLVLALSDFSAILRKHGVDEAIMASGWRPPRKGWPEGKEARRHPGGMAIDIYRFGFWEEPPAPVAVEEGNEAPPAAKRAKRIRAWLDVKEDFGGRLGSSTCGPEARPPHPASERAKQLRAILCEAAAERIFTSILTPNYDRPHHNHVHLDLTPRVQWRIVR